jgi:hypothetical protein
VRRDGRQEDTLPIDRLVWLDYDAQARLYRLRDSLPSGLDPGGAYDPGRLIVQRPPSELTQRLLDRPRRHLLVFLRR